MRKYFQKVLAAALAFCLFQEPVSAYFRFPNDNTSSQSSIGNHPSQFSFMSQALAGIALPFKQFLRLDLKDAPWLPKLVPVEAHPLYYLPLGEPISSAIPYQRKSSELEAQRVKLKTIERVLTAIESMDHGLRPACDIHPDLAIIQAYLEQVSDRALDEAFVQSGLSVEYIVNLHDQLEKLRYEPTFIKRNLETLIKNVRENEPTMDVAKIDKEVALANNHRETFHNIFRQLLDLQKDIIGMQETIKTEADSTDHGAEAQRLMQTAKFAVDRAVRKMRSRIHMADATFSREEFSVADLINALKDHYNSHYRIGHNEKSPSGKELFWLFANLDIDNPKNLLLNADYYSVLGLLVTTIDNALQHSKDDVRVILTQEKTALRIDVVDNGFGYPPRLLKKDPVRNRIMAYTYRVTERPDYLPKGTGVGKTDAWIAKTDAGARLDLDSRPPRPTRETFHFALGPAIHLKIPRIPPDKTLAETQHVGIGYPEAMPLFQMLTGTFFPPLLQNMIFVIQDRLDDLNLDGLWGMLAELTTDPATNQPIFQPGETVYELLAKPATFLTAAHIKSDLDLLEERDPLVLERYWRSLWLVMTLTEITLQDPHIFDPAFSVYEKVQQSSARERDPRGSELVPAEFVYDHQSGEYSAAELEEKLFAWSMAYARPMNLKNRLFRYFSKHRARLRSGFALALNGVPLNGQPAHVAEGDRLEIIRSPNRERIDGSGIVQPISSFMSSLWMSLTRSPVYAVTVALLIATGIFGGGFLLASHPKDLLLVLIPLSRMIIGMMNIHNGENVPAAPSEAEQHGDHEKSFRRADRRGDELPGHHAAHSAHGFRTISEHRLEKHARRPDFCRRSGSYPRHQRDGAPDPGLERGC